MEINTEELNQKHIYVDGGHIPRILGESQRSRRPRYKLKWFSIPGRTAKPGPKLYSTERRRSLNTNNVEIGGDLMII